MLDDDFFLRFASMFEEEATTLLAGVDNIPHAFDVTVAPPAMVRQLGSWIGLPPIDSALDERLQRRLVRAGSAGLAWRGTRRALQDFLEVVTEGPAVVEESGSIRRDTGEPAPDPLVIMRVQGTGRMPVREFVALVEDEMPANARFEVWIAGRRVWPADQPGTGEEDAGEHGDD
ncbi:MAG TPA: phage tail protein [Acidimicrobiales bacterium]|nr:phage tail protein [Acidimicrobiales bacterium]